MALQEIWNGTISFSLVAIPVKLVRAVESGRVSFRMLHSKDYSPLARRMYCPREEAIIPAEQIVRGYEIAPDTYIVITDKELESVSPERSRTIEIIEFIDIHDVEPVYYDHPYYLVPSKGGEKAYRLLVEVMHQANKAGIAKFVLRDREYLVAVKSTDGALALITLHYSGEILSADDLAPKDGKSRSGEEKTGQEETGHIKKMIKEMTGDFRPDKYADERRKKIMKLLDLKAKQKGTVQAPEVEEEEGEGPVDLVAVLEESMRQVKKRQ